MQLATTAYKQQMEQHLRNHSYCVVTIGAINQLAQQNARITSELSYISNSTLLLDGQVPELRYATLEQNWFRTDGSMLFPERPNTSSYFYNQGAVSKNILGAITFTFPVAYDIKGLTIDFAPNYPTDFTVTNGTNTYTYTGNNDAHFVTDAIFDSTSYITITPTAMVNGSDRLRIDIIYFGVGIQFTNQKLQSVQKRENVSAITESLPAIDLSVTIENYDKAWNVNNSSSSINYLETGQDVKVTYGYELNDGSIYWIDGAECDLKSWKANEREMSFEAQDKLAKYTENIYYGGEYYTNGITLYNLAILVLNDAGVDDDMYVLDNYLKRVTVRNPLPAVSHAECLQIIANCGRCRLFTDRLGRICIQAAFEMEINTERMSISSSDATPFSSLKSVIVQSEMQSDYAMMTQDYFKMDASMYFLPRNAPYLVTGFVSKQVSNASGVFSSNPKITVGLESSATFFGINLTFAANPPKALKIHSYYEGALVETYNIEQDFELVNQIEHEFPRMDSFVIEFTRTVPNNRIYLSAITFGEQTDYKFTRTNMTGIPTGEREGKIKDVHVIKSVYSQGTELQTIANETVNLTGLDTYTFYFSSPSHNYSAKINNNTAGIVDASAYFITLNTSQFSGSCEIVVNGYSYVVTEVPYVRVLNTTGTNKTWTNPLVSDDTVASLLAEWIGDYYDNNAIYTVNYRGEPRLDAGDYAFMDDDYLQNMMVQIESHDLSFNGALSGSVTARLARNGV